MGEKKVLPEYKSKILFDESENELRFYYYPADYVSELLFRNIMQEKLDKMVRAGLCADYKANTANGEIHVSFNPLVQDSECRGAIINTVIDCLRENRREDN